MPTYLMNKEGQSDAIAYTYSELTTEKILVETETYKEKLKEYQKAADDWDGGITLRQFYDYLGMDEDFDSFIKSSLINGMIEEGKLKSYHDRMNDKFLWFLC